MDRRKINGICAIIPIFMSALAISLLLSVLLFHSNTPQPDGDEGSAAHLFQLLTGGQVPFIAVYLITADWRRWVSVAGRLSLQLGAILAAFAPVAYFHM
jgi:hypothetical protein